MGQVYDVLHRPVAPAVCLPHVLVAAGQHLVHVWDDLEALAEDEDGDDRDQDAGQVQLLLVNGTCDVWMDRNVSLMDVVLFWREEISLSPSGLAS